MSKMMTCVKCEIEFDLAEKIRTARMQKIQPGKINECLDCAEDTTVVLTGMMIYGHKTAGSIQINKDPALTEYMRKAGGWGHARSLGQTSKISSLDTETNRVHTEVRDVAKRRE